MIFDTNFLYFSCIVLVILIATLVYSIDQEIISNLNVTSNTINLTLTPSLVLLTRSWPISDKVVKNKTINDSIYLEAVENALNDLKYKDEIEKKIPSLKLRTPSYRHQKVVSTTEKARNLSRIGYLEEYTTRHVKR